MPVIQTHCIRPRSLILINQWISVPLKFHWSHCSSKNDVRGELSSVQKYWFIYCVQTLRHLLFIGTDMQNNLFVFIFGEIGIKLLFACSNIICDCIQQIIQVRSLRTFFLKVYLTWRGFFSLSSALQAFSLILSDTFDLIEKSHSKRMSFFLHAFVKKKKSNVIKTMQSKGKTTTTKTNRKAKPAKKPLECPGRTKARACLQ